MRLRRAAGIAGFVLGWTLCAPVPAVAQQLGQDEPIGRFVVDIRGAFARHKLEPSTAQELNAVPGNLPSHSFGLVGAAHVYPWSVGKVTFGFGGNFVVARATRTLDPPGSSTPNADGSVTTIPAGTTIRRHFTSVAPEISFNFGHRDGYSYISGGMLGRSKLFLDREDSPVEASPWRTTINYGAGARWFKGSRLAFSVDARWYSVAQQDADTAAHLVAQPRTTLLLLTGGIAIR
jgi:hypothetical protein